MLSGGRCVVMSYVLIVIEPKSVFPNCLGRKFEWECELTEVL